MDDPSLNRADHQRALAGLRRINWICRTGCYLAKEIEIIAQRRQLDSISVLDLGCGSGDVALSVTKSLSKKFSCRIEGWDISQTACDAATAHLSKQAWLAKEANLSTHGIRSSSVSFRQADVFDPHEAKFDFVYCCLFLHHFNESQAIEVMQNMRRLARIAVIVDDLMRSQFGLFLAKLGCYGLSRSPVVHFDGPQSVRAAFSQTGIMHLATRVGLRGAVLKTHWPQQYFLSWESDV